MFKEDQFGSPRFRVSAVSFFRRLLDLERAGAERRSGWWRSVHEKEPSLPGSSVLGEQRVRTASCDELVIHHRKIEISIVRRLSRSS